MAEEGLQLREASKNLSAATAELTRFNERAGVEIAKTIGADLKKGVLDPFTSAFAQVPGVGTLGAVGKTILNKMWASRKQRKEERMLRERLGLTKKQFEQMKYQKKVLDAQEKYNQVLNEGAKNLIGFTQDELLATQRAANGTFLSIDKGIAKVIQGQKTQVEKEEKNQKRLAGNAAARVEKDNREERERAYQNSIFAKIADNIEGLREGLGSFKVEDTGMGLLAPLGIIGGIITAFVGGFVKSLKEQIAAIKMATGPAWTKFAEIGTKISTFLRGVGTRIKNLFTFNFTSITESKPIKFISESVGKFTRGIRSIGLRLKGFFSSVINATKSVAGLTAEGGVIGKIMGFARGFGATLGKLFLPITIVIGAFDLITGFIDGWKESDGDSIVSKFIDGVGGALGKLIGNLIGIPMDLLKDAVAWIIGKMGFKDAEATLKSFSFADMIFKIIKAPFNLVSDAVDYIMGIFTGENNPIEDVLKGISNVADAAKNLLKGILRSILPNPKGEEGGGKIMNWIRGAVSSVIPDGVYKFAGIDPDTGERILPKASAEQIMGLGRAGLQDAYINAQRIGDADEMERLIRESEMRKQGGAETIVNNVNNYSSSSSSNNSTFTTLPLSDAALATGSTMR